MTVPIRNLLVGARMTFVDYAQYYRLEQYLFEVVAPGFARNGKLSAFDFFCIVAWKANRAKSKVAARLLGHGDGFEDLQSAVDALISQIIQANGPEARLGILVCEWGFRLPMASAILTVLYSDVFTVYDVRVCEILNCFKDAQYKTDPGALWECYSQYVQAVSDAVPMSMTLREKDRFLWGKSFATQLERDVKRSFRRQESA